MSDEGKRNTVQAIYEALIRGNKGVIRDSFADNAVLMWGPYKFEGIDEILRWTEEFHEIFRNGSYRETQLLIQGDEAMHIFVVRTTFPDGRIGELFCKGTYEFHDGKVKDFKITINRGYVLVTTEVAKKLGIRKP